MKAFRCLFTMLRSLPLNFVFGARPSWPQRFGTGTMRDYLIGRFLRVGGAAARMAALRFSGAKRNLDQGILSCNGRKKRET